MIVEILNKSSYAFWTIVGISLFAIQIKKKKTKKKKIKKNTRKSSKNIRLRNQSTVEIGNILEKKLVCELRKRDGVLVYENVLVPIKGCGLTTEIDVIALTKNGIVVFECKNYSGTIIGKNNEKQWYEIFPEKSKRKYNLYNPIMQNNGHIKHLSRYLNANIPIYNFVLFGESSNISNLKNMDNLFKVDRHFSKNIDYILNEMDCKFSPSQFKRIANSLEKLLDVSEEQRLNHIKQVNYYRKHC